MGESLLCKEMYSCPSESSNSDNTCESSSNTAGGCVSLSSKSNKSSEPDICGKGKKLYKNMTVSTVNLSRRVILMLIKLFHFIFNI